MKHQTRVILLELAIGDLVRLLRPTVDRNQRGDGTPSAAFDELTTALDRFDRAGGQETLFWALFLDQAADAPQAGDSAGSGGLRSASAPVLPGGDSAGIGGLRSASAPVLPGGDSAGIGGLRSASWPLLSPPSGRVRRRPARIGRPGHTRLR